MKFLSLKRNIKHISSGVIAGLDIGSSKVCCAIARVEASGKIHVIGVGQAASRGMRQGTIVDMEALTASIANAVSHAEEAAHETLQEVYVSISPTITASYAIGIEAQVSGHAIDEADIRKMVAEACQSVEQPHQSVIHAIPTAYDLDDTPCIRDPRGMYGERLGSNIYILSASLSILRNLAACLERCHLGIAGFVVSSYASSLSTLVEDELDLGVTLLDMGAGATSITVLHDGKLHYADAIPVGGIHVTNDIARGLSTPLQQAERLKILYGSAMVSPTDEREKIMVPQIGDEDAQKGVQMSKSDLVRIIRPRLEEIFEMVRDKLRYCDASPLAGKRLVLTGGGSQLSGILQLANMVLDKQGRLGKPLSLKGLDPVLKSPAFATTAGLLTYAKSETGRLAINQNNRGNGSASMFGRLGGWLKENI